MIKTCEEFVVTQLQKVTNQNKKLKKKVKEQADRLAVIESFFKLEDGDTIKIKTGSHYYTSAVSSSYFTGDEEQALFQKLLFALGLKKAEEGNQQ